MGVALDVRTSYGPGGNQQVSLPREGVSIGPRPDFWQDLNQIYTRLRPMPGGAAPMQAAALRAPDPAAQASFTRPAARERAPYAGPDYTNWTPRNFGTPSMSPQGRIGTYVNPVDVPLAMQGRVPTGFYEDNASGNYSYSPTVDPRRYSQPAGGRG